MARTLPVLALAAFLGLLVLACDDGPPPSAVDDEGYLAVMCANLDRFSAAILVETEEAGIAAVMPDDDVRERLAAKERSVEECREPTFFSNPPADQ